MSLDLRPLSLGELFDRAFNMYRRNLWFFVGITAVPAVLALAATLMVQVLQSKSMEAALAPADGDQQVAAVASVVALLGGAMFLMLAYWIVYMIALGATTFGVSELYVGRPVAIRQVYGKMRGRIGALILLMVLIGLRLFGALLGGALLVGIMGGLTALINPILSAVAIVIAMVGLGFGCMFLLLRYAIAVPALVIERLTAREAIKRSIELLRGRLGRAFLLLLCATMVTYATMAIFQGPFMVGAFVAGPETTAGFWLNIAGAVIGTIGATFTTPFMIIGLALIYYDARIRDEGLDLELTLAALDAPGGVARV